MNEWHDIRCPRAAVSEPGLVIATTHRHRRAVERFAYYFKREFGYDFVQYAASEGAPWNATSAPVEDQACPYLFRGSWRAPDVYIGAACFRWRIRSDHPPAWALAWVWLHPYERRHGIVTRAWSIWTARHGAFVVEPPLSPAMRAFLQRPAVAFEADQCLACYYGVGPHDCPRLVTSS